MKKGLGGCQILPSPF